MKNVKIIEMKELGKGKYAFLSGLIIHPKDNPTKYTIKLTGKNVDIYLVVGRKGIYILNRELMRDLTERVWLDYLKKYLKSSRRGSRAKGDEIKHPSRIEEDKLRNFLKEKGFYPCDCFFIDFSVEKPKSEEEAKSYLKEIEKIINKAKKTIEV